MTLSNYCHLWWPSKSTEIFAFSKKWTQSMVTDQYLDSRVCGCVGVGVGAYVEPCWQFLPNPIRRSTRWRSAQCCWYFLCTASTAWWVHCHWITHYTSHMLTVHLHQHPSHHLHHASTLRAHWAGKSVSLHPLSLSRGFTSKHSHCLLQQLSFYITRFLHTRSLAANHGNR